MIWKFSISFNRAYKKFSDLKIKISSKKWNFKFPRTHVFVNVVIKVEVPFEICCSKISLRRKKNRRIINSDEELIIKILQNPSFPWWLQISRFLPVYNRLDFFFFFFSSRDPHPSRKALFTTVITVISPPSTTNLSFREKRIKTYLHRISVSLLSPRWRVFNQELKIAKNRSEMWRV